MAMMSSAKQEQVVQTFYYRTNVMCVDKVHHLLALAVYTAVTMLVPDNVYTNISFEAKTYTV